MAAGLGFKDFTTGEILLAADVDGYLMQGVWVFADAAARTSAVTSPEEGNMSFLKDTNSTEYYSGSAWVAVGGAGGAYTSIATGSLSGTSVTISPISGSYKHLYLVVVDPIASSGRIGLRINADTGSNYQYWRADLDSATPTATSPAAVINVGGDLTSAVDWTYTFFIENYSIADLYKPITVHHRKNATSNSTSGWAHHNSATAITSLTMVNTDAVSYTSGTYTLYGVN